MNSKAFDFNKEDFKRWLVNAGLFLAPLALIYFSYVIDGIRANGVDWSDFTPNALVWGALSLYFLNAATDLIRKFVKDNTK